MVPLQLEFSLVTDADPPDTLGEDELKSLAKFVLMAEGAEGTWEIAVALVDDARLQGLHRDFMGIDAPTDIMTFPYDESGQGTNGGDLAISVDHARTQAAAWGMSPGDEVRYLVVHGLLHLLGWRDETDEDREQMLARQSEVFDRWRRIVTSPDRSGGQ